jgi:MutS domain V
MNNPVKNESYQSRRSYLTGLINKLNSRKSRLQKLSKSYSNFRLLIFLMEVIIFFIMFFTASDISALISMAVFIAVFAVVAHFHYKLDNGIKKSELWIKIKSTHLARLNLDWENIPTIKYSPDDNSQQKFEPNESDLNLAGGESLHRLINTGTSHQAKVILRNWLNEKVPSINKIYERQNLVKELIPLSRLRDKLTLLSTLSSKLELDDKMLFQLLGKINKLPGLFKLIFASLIILAPLNIFLFVLYIYSIIPAFWTITTLAYVALYHFGDKEKNRLMDEADYLAGELEKLGNVFRFLEQYPYKTDSGLFRMCEPFRASKERPSALINKIKNSITMLRIRKGNPFIWLLITIAFPIDFYLKLRLNKYEKLVADKFSLWLETWHNLEALSSLANFAFLNPEYTFPEITAPEGGKQITFNSKNLGHPLIKKDKKVCNDFELTPEGEIGIITGSNMSGKSTFVRTLGINLSLAYAGSVVNADELKISLFRIFTCIKVSDSVIDGISYFYAEVKRLKALLDEIEKCEYPVFFLIDEIFRGTNNIERLQGSSAFIKKLAQTNTVGTIATHDLELVKLSGKISKVKNYYFKEEIENGRMIFNYRINPGPCPTTNALKIMKQEGLPIE